MGLSDTQSMQGTRLQHTQWGTGALPGHAGTDLILDRLSALDVPAGLIELVPETVARENLVLPLAFDGETITFAAVRADDIALADKLRFILAKNVRLVPAARDGLIEAINHHYGQTETLSVDSMLQQLSDADLDDAAYSEKRPKKVGDVGRYIGKSLVEFRKGMKSLPSAEPTAFFEHSTTSGGAQGMFFYIVEEGQRVLVRHRDGTMEVAVGPRRLWRGWKTFLPMQHFVAYPNEYLVVRFRDGRQQHLAGPTDIWLDPREHVQVTREIAMQVGAKEAVVAYSRPEGSEAISRRVVHGPALFIPAPGEWLHTFSWHASKGGHLGERKVPNALVFQKLWLMPDQMYHDVADVRTDDDAVLTVRLMIFFELVDIDRMLDATHDPIGDLVNAATSDVVTFTGQYDFEQFKRNTSRLNDLDSYPQLSARAQQCGYRINKVVYRGYSAAEALQQMHDQAIQARTRLQLDRATEQQAQDLENYRLEAQLTRAGKRRQEQVAEVEHDLQMARQRQQAELENREAQQASSRHGTRLLAEQQLVLRRDQDAQQREHLQALHGMGVDLTAYLTQARADQVIELRGNGRPHVHLAENNGKSKTT